MSCSIINVVTTSYLYRKLCKRSNATAVGHQIDKAAPKSVTRFYYTQCLQCSPYSLWWCLGLDIPKAYWSDVKNCRYTAGSPNPTLEVTEICYSSSISHWMVLMLPKFTLAMSKLQCFIHQKAFCSQKPINSSQQISRGSIWGYCNLLRPF